MESNWLHEKYDQLRPTEQGGERRPQGFDAHKDWSQRAQQEQAIASSSTFGGMDQGQQAFEGYNPTAYLPRSAFGTHLSDPASSEVMAPAYGGSYASMGEVPSSSTGFMAEGNNPYSTYGYGDQQLASREARNEASLGSETGQKSGMPNYLEAESRLLATQKAELEEQDIRNAHELQSTDDPVWLDFYQDKHTNEATLLRLQQQQNREELQTAYGLQHYEKFMVNNPEKSAYTYMDTVLKEATGKSRQQLSTEYTKRGESASAYIDNVLKEKTGKSQTQLRNAFSRIETGKTVSKLRDEKLMREIGKTAKMQRTEKSRKKTGRLLDKPISEKLKEKTGKSAYQNRNDKLKQETGKSRDQLVNEKAKRETGKSRSNMRTEAEKSGKSYKEIYQASAQAYQRSFE
jgi:hypothetical protein